MKTIILAIVASVMLAATAHAQSAQQHYRLCHGILYRFADGILFFYDGSTAPGTTMVQTGACLIEPSEASKVLATCALGYHCWVQGESDDCDLTLFPKPELLSSCSNITRVLTVQRTSN